MLRKSARILLVTAALASLLGCLGAARASSLLYNQAYDGSSPAVPSQVFTDTSPPYSNWSTKAFDDFTVTGGGWLIQAATFYGQEQGDPTQNVSINLQFQSTPLPEFSNTNLTITGGTEAANGNLSFNGLSFYLAPGTYWITSWVDRPELPTGGQWFWDTTNPGNPIGSEFYIQNPGGALIPGATSAVPGSSVLGIPSSDLAFSLYGVAVPEPSSVLLLAVGGAGALVLARRGRMR